MTLEDLTNALKSSDAPAAMLQAGVEQSDALAPSVLRLAEAFCRGVYLIPGDSELLFHGLHVLAAAKHPGLYEHLLGMARLPEDELDLLFPLHASTSLTRLILSVWDGDTDALFAMIEDKALTSEARWALFDVIARLTFDGRIPRDCTRAFLERLERDHLINDDDQAWWGWEEAVTKLGLIELEPVLERVWTKSINDHHGDSDQAEALADLHRAAASPTDPSPFDETGAKLIDDPAEAVAWRRQRTEAEATWRAEHAAAKSAVEDHDPAAALRLTAGEEEWLAGLLTSRQAPDTTMPLEMVDGLLTALVIGPAMVMPSEYMARIWGTDSGQGPVWEGMDQAQYFMNLLMKQWNAIAARRSVGALHVPILQSYAIAERGREWAEGFLVGIHMRRDAWEPMLRDQRAGPFVIAIMALAGSADNLFEEPVTPEARAETLDQLPQILRLIAAYWHDDGQAFTRRQPMRSKKVGRNEPCPCGSGKKYKKCCGTDSPTLH